MRQLLKLEILLMLCVYVFLHIKKNETIRHLLKLEVLLMLCVPAHK
jgi:hypothetical protein